MAQAQAYVIEDYRFVVDIALAKFFDRVNRDRLMAAVAARAVDRRLLRLIGNYPTAGVLDNGLFEDSLEGTPQGGPLSPLLSNLVLDEQDRELDRRGHRFGRYADVCNIYVRSEKAGRRVMASPARFIERRRKLQINAEKSAVARPWQRSFLGFTARNEPEFRRCIADKAVIRFKHRVREPTGQHRGIILDRMIRELASYLRGWAGDFGFSQWRALQSLDSWIRRRLRCVVWAQWRRGASDIMNSGASVCLGRRPNVRSLIPSSSAASSWFNCAASQWPRMLKNLITRTPLGVPVQSIQTLLKGLGRYRTDRVLPKPDI